MSAIVGQNGSVTAGHDCGVSARRRGVLRVSDRIAAVVLADQLSGGAPISDRAPGQAERRELPVMDMAPTIRSLDD